MANQLKAEIRTGTRGSDIHQLRASGMIPAALYGKKVSSAAIAVSEKDLNALLKKNPHAVIDLEVPEIGTQPVMVNEIQRDKLSGKVLHIDFHQISMNEPVKATVAVELSGQPQGVKEGGILQVGVHEVEVRCLPKDLPASLAIDISKLLVGENVLASDLPIPEGVELLTEPTDMLVTILAPAKQVEETEEEAANPTGEAAEASKDE